MNTSNWWDMPRDPRFLLLSSLKLILLVVAAALLTSCSSYQERRAREEKNKAECIDYMQIQPSTCKRWFG